MTCAGKRTFTKLEAATRRIHSSKSLRLKIALREIGKK